MRNGHQFRERKKQVEKKKKKRETHKKSNIRQSESRCISVRRAQLLGKSTHTVQLFYRIRLARARLCLGNKSSCGRQANIANNKSTHTHTIACANSCILQNNFKFNTIWNYENYLIKTECHKIHVIARSSTIEHKIKIPSKRVALSKSGFRWIDWTWMNVRDFSTYFPCLFLNPSPPPPHNIQMSRFHSRPVYSSFFCSRSRWTVSKCALTSKLL